jgi:hypothetical protein
MRRVVAVLLMWALGVTAWAAGRPLHEEDAKRLEAFVLAENLLDFAARANSARAYLMAAELRLLYPVTDPENQPAQSIQTLLARGQQLAPGDAAVQMWARQLSKLANKSPRGEGETWRRVDVHLEANQVYRQAFTTTSGERLVMLAKSEPDIVLTLRKPDGSVWERTSQPWLYFPGDQSFILEITCPDSAAREVTLLVR